MLPLSKSSDFTTVTESFHSLPQYNASEPKCESGDYEDGDIFLLATDALAEWVLRDLETQKREGKRLISLVTQKEFEGFVQYLRQNKLIKNDDTTLCMLKVGAVSQKQASSPNETTSPRLKWEQLPPETKHSSVVENPDALKNQPPLANFNVQPEDNKEIASQENKAIANKSVPPPNDRSLKWLIIIVVALLGLMIGILSWWALKNSWKIGNNKPGTGVALTPQLPGNSLNETNDSSLNDISKSPFKIPIYSPTSDFKPIGFLYKKPDNKENEVELVVHTPKDYLKPRSQQAQTEWEIEIPLEEMPLPLYMKTTEGDFLGYLLPGTYSVFIPKGSPPFAPTNPLLFNESRWVEIKVKLSK